MSKTATAPRRLSEFAPADGELTAMADIEGRDLLLQAADEVETTYGPGYRLSLFDPKTGEGFTTITSAVVVCKQIALLKQQDPFEEVMVTFAKAGRAWIIV